MVIITVLLRKLKRYRDPIGYWKKLGAEIGDKCVINSNADLGSEPYLVKIGNHVRISHGVRFFTHDGSVWVLRNLNAEDEDIDLFGKISIGNNVHIAPGVNILPGVTVGNNRIIGINSTVTKDVPDNSVVAGFPARSIETVDAYRQKHAAEFHHTYKFSKKEKKEYLRRIFP